MLADMAIGVESARLCYQKAAWMADQVNTADAIRLFQSQQSIGRKYV